MASEELIRFVQSYRTICNRSKICSLVDQMEHMNDKTKQHKLRHKTRKENLNWKLCDLLIYAFFCAWVCFIEYYFTQYSCVVNVKISREHCTKVKSVCMCACVCVRIKSAIIILQQHQKYTTTTIIASVYGGIPWNSWISHKLVSFQFYASIISSEMFVCCASAAAAAAATLSV